MRMLLGSASGIIVQNLMVFSGVLRTVLQSQNRPKNNMGASLGFFGPYLPQLSQARAKSWLPQAWPPRASPESGPSLMIMALCWFNHDEASDYHQPEWFVMPQFKLIPSPSRQLGSASHGDIG